MGDLRQNKKERPDGRAACNGQKAWSAATSDALQLLEKSPEHAKNRHCKPGPHDPTRCAHSGQQTVQTVSGSLQGGYVRLVCSRTACR
jgi:hypothetical protein